MKDIILNMTSVEVKSKTKQLRATWSKEIVQDLQSYHGFDTDAFAKELVKNMRRERRQKSIKNIFSN